ncbi:MAG: cytochrome P450 [Mycobacterium sp.]
MELFRTISPNVGSISALAETSEPVIERHSFIINPHTSTSHDPVQWTNPDDFDPAKTFEVKDGRKAPFGFGYRRCPGEQLTVMAFEDLIRKAWKDRLSFVKTGGGDPKQVPIGPTTVIGDDMGFRRLS